MRRREGRCVKKRINLYRVLRWKCRRSEIIGQIRDILWCGRTGFDVIGTNTERSADGGMKPIEHRLVGMISRIRNITSVISADQITVYAAQASFFVIISAVPFISLLMSVIGLLIPADVRSVFQGISIPEQLASVLGTVLDELEDAPNVPLLSVSAVTTLWTASKGTAAIRAGLETVYRAKPARGFFRNKIKSLISTLISIVLTVAVVVLLLFGTFLAELIGFPHNTALILRLRFPVIFALMCFVFCIMYSATARRSHAIRSGFWSHLPGAVFAAVGWVLFSFFYSLYITFFPNASVIYGGLAAVCLIMLWIYFCTVILLLGAEVNRLFFARQNRSGSNSALLANDRHL